MGWYPVRVRGSAVTIRQGRILSTHEGGGGGGGWLKTGVLIILGAVVLAFAVWGGKKMIYDKLCGGYNHYNRGGWHSRNSVNTRMGGVMGSSGQINGRNPDTFSPFSIGSDEGDNDSNSIELGNLYLGKGGDVDSRSDGVTKLEEEFDGSVGDQIGYVPPTSPGALVVAGEKETAL